VGEGGGSVEDWVISLDIVDLGILYLHDIVVVI